MIVVEGRTFFAILIYLFTFLGYLLEKGMKKEKERQKLLEKIKIIENFEEWLKGEE